MLFLSWSFYFDKGIKFIIIIIIIIIIMIISIIMQIIMTLLTDGWGGGGGGGYNNFYIVKWKMRSRALQHNMLKKEANIISIKSVLFYFRVAHHRNDKRLL